jgi:hypothetical protein
MAKSSRYAAPFGAECIIPANRSFRNQPTQLSTLPPRWPFIPDAEISPNCTRGASLRLIFIGSDLSGISTAAELILMDEFALHRLGHLHYPRFIFLVDDWIPLEEYPVGES